MALEQQQSTARKTPFYHEHLAHGAKIVPFAGWLMPLHYGSQLKEHEAVRQDVGMFDVSHMALVDVKGPNAKLFLQYVLANDVGKIEPGRALYGCMLNQQGGIIDDLITYQLGPNHYRLIVNAATTAKDLKWLEDHNRDHEVNLEVMSDLSLLAVQGPNAKQKVAKALNMDVQTLLNLKPFRFTTTPSFTIASTGYTGEDGVEIMGSNEDCLTLFKALVEQGVIYVAWARATHSDSRRA